MGSWGVLICDWREAGGNRAMAVVMKRVNDVVTHFHSLAAM